jgi:hypothetical protein
VSIAVGIVGLIAIILIGLFALSTFLFLFFAIKGIIDETSIYKIVFKESDDIYFIKKRSYIFFWRYVKGGDSFKHNFPLKFYSLGDASGYVRNISKENKPKFLSKKYRISERKNHRKDGDYRYIIERRVLFGLVWVTVNHNNRSYFKSIEEAESFIRTELIGDRIEVVKSFSRSDFN